MKKTIIATIFICLVTPSFSQSYDSYAPIDYMEGIKDDDLSNLLISDSLTVIDSEGFSENVKRPEILGFIGENYQRLQIHFISVIKNPEKPTEYFVFGKTKVKGNVCSFHGTMQAVHSGIQIADSSTSLFGFVEFEVKLYEDQKQAASGYFAGKLKTTFVLALGTRSEQKGISYNGTGFNADKFCNNQFVGTWTSYATKAIKKCHWGEFRIPECGDLDIGAGEFSVSEKYVKNGWENYMLLLNLGDDAEKRKRALANEIWW